MITTKMDNYSLILSMAVANQIFTCVSQLNEQSTPAQIIGIVCDDGSDARFSTEDTDVRDSELRLDVYTSIPDKAATTEKFLVVETGTKGVLEIRGYRYTANELETFDIHTR